MSEMKTMEGAGGRESAASEIEARGNSATTVVERAATPSHPRQSDQQPGRRQMLPFILTIIAITVAGALGMVMWNAYMGAPWTRDGTVRAYVVTMAPEVAGRIVE